MIAKHVIAFPFILIAGDFTKKYNAAKRGQLQSNPNLPSKKHLEPSSKVLKKFESKINLGTFENRPLSHSSISGLNDLCRKTEATRNRSKDKADRATTEQVLDPRTRMILFKLLNRGFITEINGCISTGKEANVYHASSPQGDCAVKIYKTSILVFKDRDKYVTGEFRFRHGYSRHNPRKMVRLWAEKEMRNLSRLHKYGIPCPKPLTLKSHVFVMEFLGKDGWPYPKLKEVSLSETQSREAYMECVLIVRHLYHDCHLVHADLSEYNILYHEGTLFIIDVSQAVEHDHPHALEFLRKDCSNITEFFRRNGVCVMTAKELFEFVTDPTINQENMEDYLDKAQARAVSRGNRTTTEQWISEAVFQKVFIPRTLDEVVDHEKDFCEVQSGKKSDLAYQTVTGLRPDLSGAQTIPHLLEDELSDSLKENCKLTDSNVKMTTAILSSDEDDNDSSSSSLDEVVKDSDEQQEELTLSQDKERKKAHKQTVKEENRERRKNKIPKHVKKRKEKITKRSKK